MQKSKRYSEIEKQDITTGTSSPFRQELEQGLNRGSESHAAPSHRLIKDVADTLVFIDEPIIKVHSK